MKASDLLPGERILASSCRHWVVLLRPIATTVLAVAVSLVILSLVPISGEPRLLLMLGAVLVGLGVVNLYYWGWRAHEYILTDQRVILNEGILSTVSRSIAIDRIQDLTTFQGLWGRTWGFGDIELESAGREGAELLSTVPRPQQLRNAIFSQIEARRRQPGGSANP
ncbi:MAG: PH domain-containing protein [Candidatus Dormibacteraeota bacterium]|nr:PH domain-containing protein [Candidatus Dormibacteraeota bacterium]